MSWIDKEVRRRSKHAQPALGEHTEQPGAASAHEDLKRIAELWARFETANSALPPELQLPLQRDDAARKAFAPERAMFQVILMGGNDAGIGYTGDAIRYFWPKKNFRTSNNFWIRHRHGEGYILTRRQQPGVLRLSVSEQRFDERRIEHILKCLVTAQRVTWRSVGKRRFGLF